MIITRELCAKLVICVLLLGDGGSAKGIRKGNPRRGGSPNHLSSENLSHRVYCKPCRQIQTLGQGITSLSTLFMQCVCVDRPGDFPVALVVKNTSANAGDMRHRFNSWEDPQEEEMATHSSILVWRIPWTEEPGAL